MFNPLLLADWGSISRGLTLLAWLVVLVLAVVIAGHLGHAAGGSHTVRHVFAMR